MRADETAERTGLPVDPDRDRPGSDPRGTGRPGSDRPGSDRRGIDRRGSDRRGIDRRGSDRRRSDRRRSDRPEDRRRPRRAGGLASRLRPGILAAIAAGGALGAAARYGIEEAVPTAPNGFPAATFAINVSGSLALALLLVFVLEIWPPTRYVRPFAAIGFLGAYTTFSTWMVETAELAAHGRPAVAAGYLAGSLVGGLATTSLGLVLGRAVLARRSTGAGSAASRGPAGRS